VPYRVVLPCFRGSYQVLGRKSQFTSSVWLGGGGRRGEKFTLTDTVSTEYTEAILFTARLHNKKFQHLRRLHLRFVHLS